MSPEDGLSTTSYAVLGLLTFADEASGYDVTKFAEQSVGYFWSPAKSHVYSELRRLAAAGYARERRVEQDARPNKRLYAITDEGRAALQRWLAEGDITTTPPRSALTLKVFFGHLVAPAVLRAQIERKQQEAQAYVAELRSIEEDIKDDPEVLFPYLTLKQGLAHAQAEIDWTQEVLDELTRKEDR